MISLSYRDPLNPITNQIVQACNLVGIKALDHIIIGKNKDDFVNLFGKRVDTIETS